jgi:hypothetical protein
MHRLEIGRPVGFADGLDHLDRADMVELTRGVAIVLEMEGREVVEALAGEARLARRPVAPCSA